MNAGLVCGVCKGAERMNVINFSVCVCPADFIQAGHNKRDEEKGREAVNTKPMKEMEQILLFY